MRRIINSTNVSLDGLIDKMGLALQYVDDEVRKRSSLGTSPAVARC